jgi:hypothetical protein
MAAVNGLRQTQPMLDVCRRPPAAERIVVLLMSMDV